MIIHDAHLQFGGRETCCVSTFWRSLESLDFAPESLTIIARSYRIAHPQPPCSLPPDPLVEGATNAACSRRSRIDCARRKLGLSPKMEARAYVLQCIAINFAYDVGEINSYLSLFALFHDLLGQDLKSILCPQWQVNESGNEPGGKAPRLFGSAWSNPVETLASRASKDRWTKSHLWLRCSSPSHQIPPLPTNRKRAL